MTYYKNNSICIENKINAGLQPYQLQRYLNHMSTTNFVTLLNLKKSNPIDYQIIEQDQERFLDISYEDEIITWLEKCLEYTDSLKSIIHQYIQILCNLTGRIRNMEKELKIILFNKIEEVNLITTNYDRILSEVKLGFQDKLYNLLKQKITDTNWEIDNTTKTEKKKIWIKHTTIKDKELSFGIEDFSGNGDFGNDFFIGVFSSKKLKIKGLNNTDVHWCGRNHLIEPFTEEGEDESHSINSSDNKMIAELYKDEDYKNELVEHVLSQIIKYFNQHKQTLIDTYNSYKTKEDK